MARRSVPCPDSDHPVPAHQGRQHTQGVRQSVPQIRFHRRDSGCRSRRRGGAHPPRRIPEAEGRCHRQMLQDPPRRFRRGRPEFHGGARVLADGGQEDRRLRPFICDGHPLGLRRHPCPPHLQPHGAGPYEGSRGDGVRPDGDHSEGEVERHQPLPGEARAGRLPSEPPALRALQGLPVLRAPPPDGMRVRSPAPSFMCPGTYRVPCTKSRS